MTSILLYNDNFDVNYLMFAYQMVRGQDESKLPVSWLAGNTGEHATSTDALWALRDFMLQEALGVVKIM